MINTKMGAFLLVGFIAGAFVASPELRAYAANTIGSADIIDGQVKTADLGGNAVTSAKIKDGEVKTADIANGAVAAGRIADGAVGTLKIADDSITAVDIQADAVGASEIAGVDKLIFASCSITFPSVAASAAATATCSVPGVAVGDHVVVTFDADSTSAGRHCFAQTSAFASSTNQVLIRFNNVCSTTVTLASFTAAVIVYST